MKRIVYLPVEVKEREFTAKCLLAAVLAHRGFVVLVAGRSDCRRLAAEGAPGIIIDKDFTERRAAEWKRIKENGGAVFAWDEEGVSEVRKDGFRLRTGKTSVEISNGIFLWGEGQKQTLKGIGLADEKMHVVGNPRIDLLRKEAEVFYSKGIKALKKKYGEFVLINLNFHKDGGVTWADVVANENNGIISKSDRESLDQAYGYYQKLVPIYCEMIEQLANAIKKPIVIRPHPKERAMDWWHQRFKGFDNIEVTREGDANMWTRAASIMIHSGCTTAMEAYISRNPSIFYNPVKEINIPFFPELSLRVESTDELIKTVQQYFEGNMPAEEFFSDRADKLISEHVSIDDQSTSCERIANILETLELEKENNVSVSLGQPLRTAYRRMRAYFNQSKSSVGKFEYTRKAETVACVESARRMMKYQEIMDVREIGVNAFVIKKAN